MGNIRDAAPSSLRASSHSNEHKLNSDAVSTMYVTLSECRTSIGGCSPSLVHCTVYMLVICWTSSLPAIMWSMTAIRSRGKLVSEFVAVEDETGATWVLVVGGALAASCARSMAMVSVSEVFVLLASEVVRVLAESGTWCRGK